VGTLAQWIAWRLKLPSILILLLSGLALGPGLGWLQPDELLGPLLFPLVSLSVGLILFEGGLSLELQELRQAGTSVLRLITFGVTVTGILAAVGAHVFGGLSLRGALLMGSVLIVTGPTVVGPLLRHVRPKGVVQAVAKWEGIVVDPIGAILAVLVYEASLASEFHEPTRDALLALGLTLAVGTVLGSAGAGALILLLRRHLVPDALQSPMALGLALGVFAGSQQLADESGLLATTLMGFLVANARGVRIAHIIEFKENLRVILISTLFVLLAARLHWADLAGAGFGGIVLVAWLILIVRPVSVFLATWGSPLSMAERTFLALLAPRGIVAMAVCALFALRLEAEGSPDAARFTSLAVLVVLGTVSFYGLAAGPVARKLGLAERHARGILIVGASPLARALGLSLLEGGVPVLLIDSNHENVTTARMEGLPCAYGNALDERSLENLDLGGMGFVIAMTPNDEVNTLATLHFRDVFGRSHVWQLPPRSERQSAGHEMRGRLLFSREASYTRLAGRFAGGATIKHTRLSEEFDYEDFRAMYGEDAIPLLRVSKNGQPEIFEAGSPPWPQAGDHLFALAEKETAAVG
jgi:NhaP-type Na+/H+ or K+/H+ antiporter